MEVDEKRSVFLLAKLYQNKVMSRVANEVRDAVLAKLGIVEKVEAKRAKKAPEKDSVKVEKIKSKKK